MYPRAHQRSGRLPPIGKAVDDGVQQREWNWKPASQSSLDVWGGKARADQREQDARRRRDERGVFESLPSAVCSLQPATCSFWTRRQLNCIERNGTGLQVAGLAGLNGLGLNSRREARPRWPLVRLGEGGESGWRAGGSRCGANVQARVGRTASTCRIWILEVVIKWSLNCAKGSASLAAPAALAFQGFAGVG